MASQISEHRCHGSGKETGIKRALSKMTAHYMIEEGLVAIFCGNFKLELENKESKATEKVERIRRAIGNLYKSHFGLARAGLYESLRKELPLYDMMQGRNIFPEDVGEVHHVIEFFIDLGYEETMIREVLAELCEVRSVEGQKADGEMCRRPDEDMDLVWQERMAAIRRFGID